MSQITAVATASSIGAISKINADTGSATPVAGVITIAGAHGINTSGAGSTITVAINNVMTLGDLVALGAGVPALTLTTGDILMSAGNLRLPATNTAGSAGIIKMGAINAFQTYRNNTFVGLNAGNTTATNPLINANVGVGNLSLNALTSGQDNNALGVGAGALLTTGNANVFMGYNAGAGLVSGNSNVLIGEGAGTNYLTNETQNILIGQNVLGTTGENQTIRIGNPASVTATYIGGIDTVNVGSVTKVVTMSSHRLGTATITAGTGISVTPGANTITIASTGSTVLPYTPVNTTPYVALSTDYYIGVDASGGVRTVQLPNAPTTGRVFVIKDSKGSAATNNITITTVGGAVLIDGATSFVMNTAYEAVQLIFNGTSYEIY